MIVDGMLLTRHSMNPEFLAEMRESFEVNERARAHGWVTGWANDQPHIYKYCFDLYIGGSIKSMRFKTVAEAHAALDEDTERWWTEMAKKWES